MIKYIVWDFTIPETDPESKKLVQQEHIGYCALPDGVDADVALALYRDINAKNVRVVDSKEETYCPTCDRTRV